MSQIQKGETFTDVAPGKTVTSTRLNNHVDGAVLLNGAVLDQQEKTTPVAADTLLLGDSTLTSGGIPKKVQVQNLLLEVQRNGTQQYVATDTGAANAYAVALAPAATTYAAGMVVRFVASNPNTGASTLNVNALGVKTIKTRAGADLTAGDIIANQVVEVVYDGVNFQLAPALTAAGVTRAATSIYGADSGVADAYAVALVPAQTAYTAGMVVRFKAAHANSGASTLNVNAVAAVTIKKIVAGASADLAANDIQTGDIVTVIYDGTYFQMAGHCRSWDYISAPTNASGTSAAVQFAHGLGSIPTRYSVVLVQTNASAQNGYNQNDEVELNAIEDGNNRQEWSVSRDATNITVARSGNGSCNLIPKSGGNCVDISAGVNTPNFYWKLKVYASL